MALNNSQQKLRDGLPVIAVNIGGRNPDILKALAIAGADFAFVDCERTGIGLDAATEVIRAARLANLPPIVRSWTKDPSILVQYLDREVDGLVVPHIETAQEVADCVELVRYAAGERAADKTLIVQIETVSAVRNLQEIMAVPGVAAYLIGPNDLAYSITGVRGAQTPEILAAIEEVGKNLKAAGKRFGMPCTLENLPRFVEAGATFLYYPVEWLLQRAVHEVRNRLET
jgi:2-keto-3-deoxy-L-rhamnonate aldolase RhmA